ncbi:MAG: LPS export ABC transporter periplasmic protein LptC [Micropepsaceae bacterium]
MAHYVNDPRTGRLVPAEAALGAPVQRSRLDNWAFRNRPSADATVGYSRFVRIMKVMLPLIAFSLIVLVVVYSTLRREGGKIAITGTILNDLSNDRQLVKPKLTGTDGRGQPFTVTADSATSAQGKTRSMVFDSVVADVTMQDKSWVQIDATKGLLNGEAKTLDLTDTINIFSDKGYECHTASARYDFGLGLLKGEQPIKCQGPLGLITGQKFEGLRDPGIMRFTGGVTTTYFPAARQGVAAQAAETNPEGIAEALPEDDVYDPTAAQAKPALSPSAPVQPKAKPAVP